MAPFFLKNRRYVMLTYSQAGSDFDYWSIVELLSSHGAECIIGRELHADGGTHFHVFVDFGRLFQRRKTDLFDVGGKHPNIMPVWKTPGEAFDYATKDGDIVAGGLERPGTDCDYDTTNFWATAGASQSGEEFLHFLDQLAPRDLMRGFLQFRSYADWKWAVAPERYVDPPGVVFDTGHAEQLSERKSLMLWGPSQFGKTTWARSLGNHIFFGSQFSGKLALDGMDDAQYAIFDDWKGGMKALPGYKDWFGCQWQISVRKLHHDARLITWGRPIIWLCNKDPRLMHIATDDVDWEWMDENVMFVEIVRPLVTFHANT
ncbi:replication associated protein [Lynx canadensis faeces associated genomovirus CL3 128]|nr:replication associated protein [Lynx canadensis faeces associated genomovirus CL3 128]